MTCQHIRTSDKGTQWCDLAEERIRELEASFAACVKIQAERDRLREAVNEAHQRIRKLEEENMQWAKEVSRLREELNTQDTEIAQLRAVIESQLEGE